MYLQYRLYLLFAFFLLNLTALDAQVTLDYKNPDCDKPNSGEIMVKVAGGSSPYRYKWDDLPEVTFDNPRIGLSGGTYKVTVFDKYDCRGSASVVLSNSSLTASISASQTVIPIGADGCRNWEKPDVILTASATGGSGVNENYLYNWGDGFTPNPVKNVSEPGTQTVTVKDMNLPGCNDQKEVIIEEIIVNCSMDPNDITGPAGYGPEKWVSVNDRLSYLVRFENDPELATAAALRVLVEVPLDNHVNPQSLRLGDFGFANMNFTVPENQVFYSKQLDVRDSLEIYVQVTAGIDLVNKKAFWILESIDPLTGLNPTSPDLGLLPVNDTITRRGEGYINFSVRPKESTLTRDSIVEFANIIFDDNEAILTNRAVNLVDAFPPTSTMDPIIADSTDAEITLSWNAIDDTGGVGVGSYAIYYSKNGFPFQLYENEILTNSISFPVIPDTDYSFYTIATDLVGNIESQKTIGEASFSSASVPTLSFLSPLGDSFCQGDSISISWKTFDVPGVNILFSVDGETYNPITTSLDSTVNSYIWAIPQGVSCEACQFQLVSTSEEAKSRSNSFGIYDLPQISAGEDASVCLGSNIELQASGGNTYNWTTSNTLNNTNTSTPIATPTETTTYTLQGTDINGCRNTAEVKVVVNEVPTAILPLFDVQYCVDADPVNLTGNPLGGNFVGYTVENNTFNPQTAGAGTYILTYVYTDANGCNGTASQPITVNDVPEVEFSGLEDQYLESDAAVSLVGTPAGGSFSGVGIDGNTFDPATATPGTYEITYTFQNDNLCESTSTQSVTVFGNSSVFFTGLEDQYCENEAIISLNGNPVGGTFSGTGITNNSFSPIDAGVGTHEISYTLNGETSSKTVTVLPIQNLNIAGLQDSFCIGNEQLILNGNPVGGMLSGPGVDGNYFNLETAGIGIHNITYTFENANGCTSIENKTVTILAPPEISFTGLEAFYNDSDATVTLEGIPAGGTFSGNGIIDNTFDPSLANNGYNTITYQYTDMFSCTNTYDQDVEVYAPNAAFISGLSTYYCENDEAVILVGNPIGGEFSGPGMTGNTFTPTEAGSGQHTITYSFTDTNGEITNISNNTIVDQLPEISINNGAFVYCVSDTNIPLDATPYGGEWSGVGVNDFAFNPNEAGVGTHVISYAYTDDNGAGCSSNVELTMIVGDIVEASIENLDSIYCIDTEETSLWLNPPGGTLSGNGIVNETFHPSLAGEGQHLITYTYQDPSGGCSSTYTTNIVVTASSNAGMSISGIDSSYCIHAGDIELIGNPAGGTFSGPGMDGNIFRPTELGNTTITYTLNNGFCQGSYQQEVNVVGPPVVEVTTFPSDVVCAGNSITLTATGADNYEWTTGENQSTIFVTTAGTYSVTITDTNGCTNTSDIAVAFYEAEIPEITMIGDTLYSTTASTFQWYLNNEPIENATADFHAVAVDGEYKVIITDSNGCTGHSESFDFVTTYVQDLEIENITIHPNPIIDYFDIQFNINGQLQNLSIELTDAKGVLILAETYGDVSRIFQERLEVTDIPSGIYFLNIVSSEGRYVEKIIVVHQ